MTTKDPQKTWNEYYEKKKRQRMEEATKLWEQMSNSGVTAETVLAIDFLHFGTNKENVNDLEKQLSENYEVEVVPGEEEGYCYIKGTTRPYGINLSKEQHAGWVEFMSDMAQSYACVFSTWSIEAPSLGVSFDSESIESDS